MSNKFHVNTLFQNRMNEEWREFVLGPTSDEIIEELAKNTEGEFLQVRKPLKKKID